MKTTIIASIIIGMMFLVSSLFSWWMGYPKEASFHGFCYGMIAFLTVKIIDLEEVLKNKT